MPVRHYPRIALSQIRDRDIRAALKIIDDWAPSVGPAVAAAEAAAAGGGGGGAPTTASYITAVAEAALTGSRLLVANAPVTSSDGGGGGNFTIGVTLAVPTFSWASAFAAGGANSLVRSDATLRFPPALISTANNTTLTLTDNGSDQTLTGTLGRVELIPESYIRIAPTTPDPAQILAISMNLSAGARVGIRTDVSSAGATLAAGEVMRSWNSNFALTCTMNGATVEGYGMGGNTITPAGGSGAANIAYGMHLLGPTIGNANGSWDKAVGAFIEAPRRAFANPTVTYSATIEGECPTISASDQYGLWLKQRTAQQTATNRYGIKVDEQNSGTNRWGAHISDRVHIQSPAARAITVLNLSQLSTGATAGAHINFDDKAGNPGAPNTGDLWRNADALNFRKAASTVDLALRPIPISEGGTGQMTATAAFNALDPLTTKGDLLAHDGTDSVRLAVGTDTHVLTADSTAASGVKWAVAPGAGGGDAVSVNS